MFSRYDVDFYDWGGQDDQEHAEEEGRDEHHEEGGDGGRGTHYKMVCNICKTNLSRFVCLCYLIYICLIGLNHIFLK